MSVVLFVKGVLWLSTFEQCCFEKVTQAPLLGPFKPPVSPPWNFTGVGSLCSVSQTDLTTKPFSIEHLATWVFWEVHSWETWALVQGVGASVYTIVFWIFSQLFHSRNKKTLNSDTSWNGHMIIWFFFFLLRCWFWHVVDSGTSRFLGKSVWSCLRKKYDLSGPSFP